MAAGAPGPTFMKRAVCTLSDLRKLRERMDRTKHLAATYCGCSSSRPTSWTRKTSKRKLMETGAETKEAGANEKQKDRGRLSDYSPSVGALSKGASIFTSDSN